MIDRRQMDDALKALIKLGTDEAMMMGHAYLGTEHLLLAMTQAEMPLIRAFFAERQITTDALREEILRRMGRGLFTAEIEGVSPRAKDCLASMARDFRPPHRPDHLLVKILEDPFSVATKLLANWGVDEGDIRAFANLVAGGPASGADTTTLPQTGETAVAEGYFGEDLTRLAAEGLLDNVVGREREIDRILQLLTRRQKNNPCLVGEPGVGKTVIVEGLAHRLVAGDVPPALKDKRLVSVSLASLVAGTKYRGDFEKRLKELLDRVKEEGDVILFFDEIHNIIGTGSTEGSSLSAANILKPALARGDIQLIGATTSREFSEIVERDRALERRLQQVRVDEPTEEEALAILEGVRRVYEDHHQVHFDDEALRAAVGLSVRYINDRFLPDKAVDLIDEAASRLRLERSRDRTTLERLRAERVDVRRRKEELIARLQFEMAAELVEMEKDLDLKIERETEEARTAGDARPRVTVQMVEAVIADWTKIPVERLARDEKEKLLQLEALLGERVVGQEEAINLVARALRRSRVGLSDPGRPMASLVFLGPTGVGKTELCKVLAEVMFGSQSRLFRYDMSEYMERFDVSKLIGAPPGYAGFDVAGHLTEPVRRQPYALLLFDEFEKAHRDVQNLLLQILDEGHLTDARGRRVSFRQTIIILTSNLGIDEVKGYRKMGFGDQDPGGREAVRERILDEMKAYFRPEFLGRIDDVVIFNDLTETDLERIVALNVKALNERLKDKRMHLSLTPAMTAEIVKRGYLENYGARPLTRALRELLEDPLAEGIIRGDFAPGDRLIADWTAQEVDLKKE